MGPHEGDGDRGEQGGEHDGDDPRGADGDAQPAGGVVTEGQGVDPAGEEQQSDEAGDADRRHLQHAVEPVLGDAALVPLEDALRLLGKQEEQPLGHGGEAEGEGAAREDEPYGAGAQTGQPEDDRCRHEAAA